MTADFGLNFSFLRNETLWVSSQIHTLLEMSDSRIITPFHNMLIESNDEPALIQLCRERKIKITVGTRHEGHIVDGTSHNVRIVREGETDEVPNVIIKVDKINFSYHRKMLSSSVGLFLILQGWWFIKWYLLKIIHPFCNKDDTKYELSDIYGLLLCPVLFPLLLFTALIRCGTGFGIMLFELVIIYLKVILFSTICLPVFSGSSGRQVEYLALNETSCITSHAIIYTTADYGIVILVNHSDSPPSHVFDYLSMRLGVKVSEDKIIKDMSLGQYQEMISS